MGYVEVAGHEYGVVLLLFVMRDLIDLLWEINLRPSEWYIVL